MKKAYTLTCLFCTSLLVFIFQAFYPVPFPGNKEQQLLAKANMFNLRFPQEKIYLHLDRPSYWANEDIWFKAYLLNSPIPDCNLYVELLNSTGKILDKKMIWAQNGLAYGDLHVADTISSGVYQIRAYTNWMRNFNDSWFFRKNFVIWNLRNKSISNESNSLKQKDVDFQFFPEGGTFVAGMKSKVAFKATDQNGKGLDVRGRIIDDQGNELTSFRSQFKGMGSFDIHPQEGRKYTAKVAVAGKIDLTVELPVPQSNGVVLAIDPTDTSKIHVQVSDRPVTPELNSSAEYLVVGMTNGVVFYRKEIAIVQGKLGFDVEKSALPNGIIQFTLFDQEMIPRCERLVFINHHDEIQVEIKPDKSDYFTREKVQLDVRALTTAGIPCFVNLSMSVYNPDTQLNTEDYPDNILTHFLLSSELKGTIEDPAYYFKDDSLSTLLSLDNLMMTHGYRHFEWKQINDDKLPEIAYPPEGSITVKGAVKNSIVDKPIPNCKVTMLFVKNQYGLYDQTTDSQGHFMFSDLFFNDTVYVSLQALNLKNKRNTWIELDERSSLSPKASFVPTNYQYVKENPVNTAEYLGEVNSELINRKWHLSDTILLNNVNVVAYKKKKGDGNNRMYVDPDYVYDVSKHDQVYGNIIENLENDAYMMRYSNAQFYLDGVPVDREFIASMPVGIFDKVEVVKIGGFMKGGGPGVFFYLKRGMKQQYTHADAIGMKSSMVIGYSVIRKFYSPQYTSRPKTNEKEDFRSTLYWNPIVRTDSTGVANVSFYNSDQTGDVQVVVEGITADGKLCRGLGKYKVKNDF